MAKNNIDTTPSTVAMSALQALPFGTIIGGPLQACVEAQTNAAQATWKFIREVGLTEGEDGEKKATYVSFLYRKNGRDATLNVPLLTIVPIPYLAIRDIDIAFKANISAAASTSTQQHESLNVDFNMNTKASCNFLIAKGSIEMNVGVSSKKDSTSTRDSKYSVEYTMDVAVKAGQDDMPAGMAKVLEMLNESIDTVEKGGELHVSSHVVNINSDSNGMKGIYITYKDENGYFCNDIKKIEIQKYKDGNKNPTPAGNDDYQMTKDEPGIICTFSTAGQYLIKAGERSAQVQVI